MTFEQFIDSIKGSAPPEGASTLLKALWFDAKGDWERAHDLSQVDETSLGSLRDKIQ